MNRTLVLLATLLLLVGGAWYWWSIQSNVPATIAITAPAGGEILQSGEKHTISWKTHGVPASDKISITIRRIPPPPLQEEGQEFDPIVFTDIPNTGSTTWTISEMYPEGTFVLGISAYAAVPITNVISAESRPFTITHPKLAIDLYPLLHWCHVEEVGCREFHYRHHDILGHECYFRANRCGYESSKRHHFI